MSFFMKVGRLALTKSAGPRAVSVTRETSPSTTCGDVRIGVRKLVATGAVCFLPVRESAPTKAPLCYAVNHVVRSCAEEQVRRIHAGRVVALVQHPQVFGDRPDIDQIAVLMGRNPGASLSRESKPPIAAANWGSKKWPALIRLASLDSFPKPG